MQKHPTLATSLAECAISIALPFTRLAYNLLRAGTHLLSPGLTHRMRPGIKNPLLRTLNLLLYLSLCAMAGTGLLLQWRLPPGSQGGKGLSSLGLDRHAWGDIHFWIGFAFIIGCLLHLAIHWRWLTQIAAKARKSMLATGLLTGATIIAFFLFIPVEKQAGGIPLEPSRSPSP